MDFLEPRPQASISNPHAVRPFGKQASLTLIQVSGSVPKYMLRYHDRKLKLFTTFSIIIFSVNFTCYINTINRLKILMNTTLFYLGTLTCFMQIKPMLVWKILFKKLPVRFFIRTATAKGFHAQSESFRVPHMWSESEPIWWQKALWVWDSANICQCLVWGVWNNLAKFEIV